MPDEYPPAPGQRLAYDLMGCQLWTYKPDLSSLTRRTTSEMDLLNNEENYGPVIFNGDVFSTLYTEMLFPYPVDFFGIWASGDVSLGPTGNLNALFSDVSVTSDPQHVVQDTDLTEVTDHLTLPKHFNTWRFSTEITEFSAENVWAIRGTMRAGHIFGDIRLHQLHLYAAPNPENNPNRVIVIDDDTGLEVASVVDWGNTARGSVRSHTFQVKNNSATHTATDVTLGFHSLNTGVAAWHEMRDGGGAWSTSLNLGNIGPGVTYANDIDVRVTVPTGAGLDARSNRLTVQFTGWT